MKKYENLRKKIFLRTGNDIIKTNLINTSSELKKYYSLTFLKNYEI